MHFTESNLVVYWVKTLSDLCLLGLAGDALVCCGIFILSISRMLFQPPPLPSRVAVTAVLMRRGYLSFILLVACVTIYHFDQSTLCQVTLLYIVHVESRLCFHREMQT